MKRLILMRHGDAERQSAGQPDFDRRLTVEGRNESRAVGRALDAAGLDPDVALVSSARRTTETWDAASEAFKGRVEVREDRGLYAAGAVQLVAAARDAAADGDVVMMVGHNPGIHQYAIHLAISAGASAAQTKPLFERFPTGTAAVFAIGDDGRPAFERLILAKDVRGK